LIPRRTGVWVLVAFTIALGAVAMLLPRIPQPQSYHDFADQRSFLGIPNFGDLASNLLFSGRFAVLRYVAGVRSADSARFAFVTAAVHAQLGLRGGFRFLRVGESL
jgi:hypothetical protein